MILRMKNEDDVEDEIHLGNEDYLTNEDDLEAGEEVVRRVEKLLAAHLPGCTVHLAGSTLSGFGLLSSPMEFKLSLPPDCSPAGAMTSASQALKKAPFFNLAEDFHNQVCTYFTF